MALTIPACFDFLLETTVSIIILRSRRQTLNRGDDSTNRDVLTGDFRFFGGNTVNGTVLHTRAAIQKKMRLLSQF